MTEKELIKKIKNFNQVEADPKWADLCRDDLIQKYWGGNELLTGKRIQKWNIFEGLADFADIFNHGPMIPARVAAPIFIIAILIFGGSVVFNMSQIQQPDPLEVINNPQVSGNSNDNGGQSQNILSESGSRSASSPSNIRQNIAQRNNKSNQSGSNPLANGFQVIIDKVRTVTIGEERDQNFEANLQKQTKDKIENLKGQVENLLRGNEKDIVLAESVMPVLKEAEDLLGQGDLIGAFEKAIAVERVLRR